MPRPARLAFVVIPLALAPLVLALREARGTWALVVFISACIAAPCAGFWFGEMKGESGPGKAALGCLGTLALIGFYVVFILFIAPRLR